MISCTIGDCDRPHFARGMCRSHYERWRLHGDQMSHDPINTRTGFDPAPILPYLNGRSDSEWARALDISRHTIGRWRNGTRTLSLNMAEHVTDRLGTHPAILWPHQW